MRDFRGNTLQIGEDIIFHLNFYDIHTLEFGKILDLNEEYGTLEVVYKSTVGSPVDEATGKRVYSIVDNTTKVSYKEVYRL